MDPSEPPPPLPAIPVSLPVASSSSLNFNQPGVHCCLLEGGWAGRGVSGRDWLRASIKYSARPVAACCVLRRRRALSTARGANPALHSSHVAVPPFIIRLTRRRQAVQSISAFPFSFYRPPPAAPPLVSRSLLFIHQHRARCRLHPSVGPERLHARVAFNLSGLFGIFRGTCHTTRV